MSSWLEEAWENQILIGGDYNARTRVEAGLKGFGEQTDINLRNSKDKIVNKEGRDLNKFVSERGWAIVNGCVAGDEEGTWTFIGERGCYSKLWVVG